MPPLNGRKAVGRRMAFGGSNSLKGVAFVQLTTLTRDAITQRVIHRWGDQSDSSAVV
jgi:hypothetical protein